MHALRVCGVLRNILGGNVVHVANDIRRPPALDSLVEGNGSGDLAGYDRHHKKWHANYPAVIPAKSCCNSPPPLSRQILEPQQDAHGNEHYHNESCVEHFTINTTLESTVGSHDASFAERPTSAWHLINNYTIDTYNGEIRPICGHYAHQFPTSGPEIDKDDWVVCFKPIPLFSRVSFPCDTSRCTSFPLPSKHSYTNRSPRLRGLSHTLCRLSAHYLEPVHIYITTLLSARNPKMADCAMYC
ncbi:hypothetical protein P153DRAFT_391263 [Dothidotthia symphoricarpi CBS 119687]|uniref:Uncharacterized protein n=1 Tax=Dothidotthia symphoricarpi CBS 119687 TaxID=1392245 RepID=A0A6A5ZWJ4_9PLEO|nr:uncharacterized protein P153DRAFT_391263 [Dothidotthia symphoricarpi CBS 119687]KAF2123666.1 hypothetical protein P153DRAFT_391263 [Dothidotthia symphoricarpi CBS 119687]